MYISTATKYFGRFHDDKSVVCFLKDNGFDAFDFTMYANEFDGMAIEDYKAQIAELTEYAQTLGIVCNQTHAPFPTAKQGDEAYNACIFQKIVYAIEVSGMLGAKVCVVHPSVEHSIEENILLFKALEPHARKANIKIGIENMTRDIGSHPTHLKAILDALPSDVFVFCLDTGHAEMEKNQTSALEMIAVLGDRLQAMHWHDCDKVRDNHGLPFTYKIDFEAILQALIEVGYKGDVMLETGSFFVGVPDELLPLHVQLAAKTAEYFRSRLQK